MSLLPKLVEVSTSIGTGLFPDMHDMREFVWADGRNVRFTGQSVKKMEGWAAPFTKPGTAPVRGIGQVLDSGGQNVFFGDAANLYLWDVGSVTTVGTSFTGSTDGTVLAPATAWSFVEWGNWCIATNGVDAMQVWKNTGNFAALGGTPPASAEIILKVKEYVIAFNVSGDNVGYAWCDIDNVEDWVATSSNRAGSNTIRDLSSRIIAAVPLGGAVAVYSKTEMALVSYIDEPYIFGHKKVLEGFGAVSKYSVVSVGRENYGFCREGIFVTDGQSFKWLGVNEVWDTISAEVNWAQESKINGFHDAANNEIRWYYPTTTSEPDKGVVLNYVNKTWSFLDHGRTASQDKKIFSYPLSAASDGAVYYENYGTDANGSAMTAYVETKANPIFKPTGKESYTSMEDVWKYIEAVKLALTDQAGAGLKVKVGIQDDKSDVVIWSEAHYAGKDMNTVFPDISGRWITLRIESDQLSDTWELQGFTLHGTDIGGPIV